MSRFSVLFSTLFILLAAFSSASAEDKTITVFAATLVARGEAALGIVYSTDAKVEPGVKIVGTFPADSHPPILSGRRDGHCEAGDDELSHFLAFDGGEENI